MISETTNEDCMQMMARYPDKWFELAIVDPPYGIGAGEMQQGKWRTSRMLAKAWDSRTPNAEYFIELERVSQERIISGGNYFSLPPTRGFIVWDKGAGFKARDFAECEMLWTSFNRNAQVFAHDPLAKGDYRAKIHPTQKPVALYKWLLTNYAKQGDKILDTHLGSQSSRIAAWDLGFDFYGCELDEDYFREGNERFERHRAQPKLFTPEVETPKQASFLD